MAMGRDVSSRGYIRTPDQNVEFDGSKNSLSSTNNRHKGGIMQENEKLTGSPEIPGFPKDWRDRIKTDLAAQLKAGGILYGILSDGAYVERTKDGDRVL